MDPGPAPAMVLISSSFKKRKGEVRTKRYDGGDRQREAANGVDVNDYEWLDALEGCNSVDWLDDGKVGQPKVQGKCGSCYAHSAVAAIETFAA